MEYKRMIRGFLCIVLAVALLSGCSNVKSESDDKAKGKKVVTLGYLPITHALPMFEAKELLESSDQDVTIVLQKFSHWTDLMDALNAGKIDGASVLIELAMSAKNKGIGLKAIALGHRDGNVIVVSDQIENVSDLKGKVFAIPSAQSSHNILLMEMLKREGISVDDIQITQMAPTEMPFSLASGAIDGYCVAEPFGAQVVSKDLGHVLYDGSELWEDSLCCAFVLREEFLQNEETTAEIVIEKYFEAGEHLDQETANRVALKYLGQEESILEQSMEWIRYDNLQLEEESYDILCEKLIAYKINENPPSYDEFVYVEAKKDEAKFE